MILPAPVREMPRPRRQRIPMLVCAGIGVAALGAVLGIALAVGSPSQAALPVLAPSPPAVSHVNHSHDVRYLRHHMPLVPGARKVRATLHRRAYTAPGGVPRVARYYEEQLRRLGLHWRVATDVRHRTIAGRVIGRDGAVANLRVEPVPGTHGALVRIVVAFRS